MEITNSTISGNRAFARGGGIMNFGTAFIAYSTITNNEANAGRSFLCVVDEVREELRACGGGIFNDGDETNLGRISIGNTILAGNTDNRTRFDTGFSPDCFSPVMFSFTSFRGNLVGILTPNCNMRDTIWGDQRFDMVGTPGVPLDPKLASLTDNGGPTATHALLPDSPAIDNGTGVTSATFFDCPSVDQRGRFRPSGDECDVGAFELVSIAALLHEDLTVLVNLRGEVTDRQDANKLDDAIRSLSNSLNSEYWVDENTLTGKGGDKVFKEQKDAVVKLTNLINHNNSGISDELQDLVDRIVANNRELVVIAIDQAVNLKGKANQIAIAQNELSKGENSAGNGKLTAAIEHYRNAWRHAQLAMKK